MSASELIRWGALSAIVGGALWVLSDLWGLLRVGLGDELPFSEEATTASFAATTGLSLLGAVLILFGLVGLNLRHAEATGVLGKVSFPIAFLGTALVIGISWAIFFVAPSAALEAPEFLDAQEVRGPLDTGFILSGFVFAVGWALFGAGAWLVRTYPRWVVIVFIVAALIQLFPFPGTGLVFGVAVALLGFFALTRGSTSYEQPSRVS